MFLIGCEFGVWSSKKRCKSHGNCRLIGKPFDRIDIGLELGRTEAEIIYRNRAEEDRNIAQVLVNLSI
jgi:hypothetical protein